MTKRSKGDKVVAIKNIGGVLRESVPKGSIGYVTDAPWGGRAEVTFTVKSFWSEKEVTIRVDDDEIA